jgi:vancomycin resistance protein YoaR
LSGCNNSQNNNESQNTQKENTSYNYTTSRTTIAKEPNSISETDIASFSTNIYIKESGRQHNISLTTSKLNGTIVKPGETFSFCNTIGKATASKGYKKADIYDSKGNVIQGYGGGNCQVSSTLYNAVLNSPNLTVLERHEHSKIVNYVEQGKDAAISYGSLDFKFRNDNNYPIKIYSSNTQDNVYIRIVKM